MDVHREVVALSCESLPSRGRCRQKQGAVTTTGKPRQRWNASFDRTRAMTGWLSKKKLVVAAGKIEEDDDPTNENLRDAFTSVAKASKFPIQDRQSVSDALLVVHVMPAGDDDLRWFGFVPEALPRHGTTLSPNNSSGRMTISTSRICPAKQDGPHHHRCPS